MKKTIFAIAALALLFTGCAKEYNETFAPGDVVTVRAQVNDTYTKVSADNNGSYSWQAKDKITIFNDAATPVNYEFSTVNGGTDAAFTCTSFEGGLGTRAYYPASANHTNSSFSLDASFDWVKDACNMPMVGTVKTGDKTVSFKTVGAVIKLVCYNVADDARKLVVSSDSKKLSGLFTPAGSPLAIATAPKGASDNTISINFAAGHPSTMVFYIPVPTGDLGKLSFVMKDGSDAEVSSAQTTKDNITMTRQHIVAAPALNCGNGEIIWSEDFSQYSENDIPNGKQYKAGSDISYSCTNGEGGSTKIYEETSAGGTSPELLVSKKSGTFKVSNIPCSGVSDMTLTFKKNNNALFVTATTGITVSGATSGSGEKTITLKNTSSLDVFDLTFTGPSGNSNTRVDDFVLIATVAISGAPSITGANNLTIAVASGDTNTASTDFTYTDPLDTNPVVATVLEDVDWLTASVTGSTLTVSAPKNTTDAQRSATVRLRATGVYKDVTVTQPSALVDNPTINVVNGDATFTATWSGVTNGTSYLAYIGENDNLEANPTSLTALTPSYDDGTSQWSVTKSGLTNGQTYYLYVKTDGVSSNYVSPSVYVKYTVKPVSNETPKTSTLTFEAKCSGSGTADDGVEWTVTSDGSESAFDSTKGIHYGTGSAAVQYIKLSTSDITGTISKVVVNASTASGVSATASVTVGGSAFGGDPQSLSSTAAEYTFNGSASGEIVVTVTKPSSATKALYVKSVVVTYVNN